MSSFEIARLMMEHVLKPISKVLAHPAGDARLDSQEDHRVGM